MKAIAFYFGLALIFSCATQKANLKCENFTSGKFLLKSKIDGSISIIERKDSIQTETDSLTRLITKAKINWTGPCEYELNYFRGSNYTQNSIHPYIQSKPLKVKILKTFSNFYVFESKMEGVNILYIDTMLVYKK